MRRTAVACDNALASARRVLPLTSQVALISQTSGASRIASHGRVVHTPCLRRRALPGSEAVLSRLSASLQANNVHVAKAIRSVLVRSSNHKPRLGNCDSRKPETSLRYLTRLGAASHRAWPPCSDFASPARATAPTEQVNHASRADLAIVFLEGPSQPAWLNLSPVTRDYPPKSPRHSCVRRFTPVLSKNGISLAIFLILTTERYAQGYSLERPLNQMEKPAFCA